MISWSPRYQFHSRSTYVVAARVALQLGSQCDSSAEEENGVEHVHHDHDNWVQRPVGVERGRDQVEEGQHGKRRRVHGVVDGAGVACESLGDHVTDEGHDEKSPQEL